MNLSRANGFHGLKAAGVAVPVIYITGNEDPTVRKAALDSGLRRVPDKAIFSAGVDGTAQESLGRVFIGSFAFGSLMGLLKVCLCSAGIDT